MIINVWKWLTVALSIVALGIVVSPVITGLMIKSAVSGDGVIVYFFWGDGCGYCASAKPFVQELTETPGITVLSYEVWNNETNGALFQEIAAQYETTPSGVPMFFIGERFWAGYSAGIQSEIEAYLSELL